jgi:hypothetical protein
METDSDCNYEESKDSGEEPPPFLRTWNRLYAAVIVYACALILALYFMTLTMNR